MHHNVVLLVLSLKRALYHELEAQKYVGLCINESLDSMGIIEIRRIVSIIEEAFDNKVIEDVDNIFMWKQMIKKLEAAEGILKLEGKHLIEDVDNFLIKIGNKLEEEGE